MPKNDPLAQAALEAQLQDAVDGTSNEIFASAFGNEDDVTQDETGDTSREELGEGLEGQHEPEEDDGESEDESEEEAESDEGDEEGEGKGKAKPEGEKEEGEEKPPKVEPEEPGRKDGRVPAGVHRQATEARRAAEAERDALKGQLDTVRGESRKEVDDLKSRLDQVLAALAKGQPQPKTDQPTAETRPDLFENPEAFVDHITKGIDQRVAPLSEQMSNLRVEMSMQLAHALHKDDFTKAFEAVSKLNPQNPDDRTTVQRIYASPNPGDALVSWHKRNETLREVGDDPSKFKERIATETRTALMKDPEFHKQLLAELRTQAEGDGTGKPNTTFRLPRSLNGATGGTTRETVASDSDGSQQGIFDSAFS